MSLSISALKIENAARWQRMTIRSEDTAEVDAVASRLYRDRTRYQAIAAGVVKAGGYMPWQCIAIIHEREASGDFDCYLGNGQPLDEVTTEVPQGRGPFYNHPGETISDDAFARGCYDALLDASPRAALDGDWSAGGILTMFEEYNGLGYAERGEPSPYVWSCTDQYVSGKYVADGVYDPNAVDQQIGCAPLLKLLLEKDGITIDFLEPGQAPANSAPSAAPTPSVPPSAAPRTIMVFGIEVDIDHFIADLNQFGDEIIKNDPQYASIIQGLQSLVHGPANDPPGSFMAVLRSRIASARKGR